MSFDSESYYLFRGVAEVALDYAHRATTVLSWGLCEQEGHLATLPISPGLLDYLFTGQPG